MNGQAVIDAVVRAAALDKAIVEENGTIFVWSATAAEQIEAVLSEAGWDIVRKSVKPCETSCAKCGSSDKLVRFFRKGQDTNGLAPNRQGLSSEWVNRKDAYAQPALKDCLVHKCRCCGHTWDSDTL